MKCVVPGSNIKIMARAIQALAKIGDEMYIHPQKANLSFRTTSLAASAYVDFTFSENFFSYYIYEDLQEEDIEKCKISMRSAMNVFKTLALIDKLETCHIEMKRSATVILFILKHRNSIVKTHLLPILDCKSLQVVHTKDNIANELSIQPSILADAILNFQQNLVEITLQVLPQKLLLRNYIDDTSNISNITRTQLVLGYGEFASYSVKEETTVTFCMKELKAVLNFAELSKVPLSIYFDSPGQPIIFSMKSSTFEGNLILSTLDPEIDKRSETLINNNLNKSIKKLTTKKATKKSKKSSKKAKDVAADFSAYQPWSINTVSKNKANYNNIEECIAMRSEVEKSLSIINKSSANGSSGIDTKSLKDKNIGSSVFSAIIKRKSKKIFREDTTDEAENITNKSFNNSEVSSCPPAKKARIFEKCFHSTFDPRMLPGHDTILVEDSDDCDSD